MGLAGKILDSWLLLYYSLAVWLTTGVQFRRRQPAPFVRLVPIINTTMTGQILSIYQSVIFLIFGRSLPNSLLILGIALVVISLIAWALPLLEKRALRQSIPARFRKLSESRRRQLAWICFFLFWGTFCGMFGVIASMN